MNKIISIAAFGSGDKYTQYLPTLVLAHANLYPWHDNWILRVHIDPIVANSRWGEFLFNLARKEIVEVETFPSAALTRAMLWRLAPVFDETADYVFCRDLDSLPMPRDRACMETFMQSKAVVSTIFDSTQHVGVMGGLCGFRAKELCQLTGWRSLEDFYKAAKSSDEAYAVHGEDQLVLNRLLLKKGGPPLLEHRYNGWHNGPNAFEKREAGSYLCPAWSTPVPDVGAVPAYLGHRFRTLVPNIYALVAEADLLAAHLGSAGYPHETARRFWERYGDPEIAKLVKECEA